MLDDKLQKLCLEILSKSLKADIAENYSDTELEELFKFLKTNNLHILAYINLRKAKIKLPGSISNEIQNCYFAACAADFKRKQQLERIVDIFNYHSIDHILLKGSVLAYTVYDEPYARLMSDIDILVKKESASKAFELLLKDGYSSFFETVEECEKVKHQFNQHYPVLKKTGCLPVELHTYLSEEYEANISGIWERAVIADLGSIQTKIMSYEDLIHHVAMHKLLHDASLNGLMGLYDIFLIMKFVDIDYEKLIKLSGETEYNNKKCIYALIHLINIFFNKEFDADILSLLRVDSYGSEIENKFLSIIFNNFSNIDKDSFLLGLNLKDTGQNFSIVMNRLFMSPYKMGRYGGRKYGKIKLTFISLCKLYLIRYLDLGYRYSLLLIKRVFIGNKTNKSVELGKSCAELKYWLKN